MSDSTIWRVLFVDDDKDFRKQAKDFLTDRCIDYDNKLSVDCVGNFDDTIALLEQNKFDLLILDVKLVSSGGSDDKKGRDVLEDIKKTCFIPTIFYTAVPESVRDETGPFVKVVEKTESFDRVIEVIKEISSTGIFRVKKDLSRYLDVVQRDYMWPFVSEHWNEYINQGDSLSLAYLLSMRLAVYFSGPAIQRFADQSSDLFCQRIVEGDAHPIQYYVMPPVNPNSLAGDIYQEQSTGMYWILFTPSCDMVQKKAEWVLLAGCLLLVEQTEYKCWRENQSKTKKEELENFLKNRRERYHYLPGAFSLPDLLVDFQRIQSFPVSELENKFNRIASLSSPFAESLISRFNRYFGRLGTPDLDTEIIFSKFIDQVLKRVE